MNRSYLMEFIGLLFLCLMLTGCDDDKIKVIDNQEGYYPNQRGLYFMVHPLAGFTDGGATLVELAARMVSGHAKMCVDQENGYLLSGHAFFGGFGTWIPMGKYPIKKFMESSIEIRFDTNMETEAIQGAYQYIFKFYKQENQGFIPIASRLAGALPGNVSSTDAAELFMSEQAAYQWFYVHLKDQLMALDVYEPGIEFLSWEEIVNRLCRRLNEAEIYRQVYNIANSSSNKYAKTVFKIAGFRKDNGSPVGSDIENFIDLGNNALALQLYTYLGILENEEMFVIDDYTNGAQFHYADIPLDGWGPAVLWLPFWQEDAWLSIGVFSVTVPIVTARSLISWLI